MIFYPVILQIQLRFYNKDNSCIIKIPVTFYKACTISILCSYCYFFLEACHWFVIIPGKIIKNHENEGSNVILKMT